MDIQRILMLVIWLAVLGGLVLFGSRIVGRVSARVPA